MNKKIKNRIDEALNVLLSLGLPKAQQNERSALFLLALLNLSPNKQWSEAENPLSLTVTRFYMPDGFL